jgi:hypothetical protein
MQACRTPTRARGNRRALWMGERCPGVSDFARRKMRWTFGGNGRFCSHKFAQGNSTGRLKLTLMGPSLVFLNHGFRLRPL